MSVNLQPLDLMALEPERRQTRPLAIKIEFGNDAYELNDDELRVTEFQGQEGVSELYQYNVEVRADEYVPVSDAELDSDLEFSGTEEALQGSGSQMLGKWSTIRIARPHEEDRFTQTPLDSDPSWEDNTPSRFFNGIISSVTHTAPGCFQLAIQSPLFPLTLRNRYTVHKDKTIVGLITELLAPETLAYNSHLTIDTEKVTGETVIRRQDWLQAGESDYAFLQRIMAKATIHFYFIHNNDQLTLVFSNNITSPQEVDIPGMDGNALRLRYAFSDIKSLGLTQDDLFCELKYQVQMVQQSVRTIFTRQQSVWETNQVANYTSYTDGDSATNVDYLHHRCFAYGVNDDEVHGHDLRTCQQLATTEGTLSGVSTSPLLSPGYTFELSQSVTSAALSTGRMPAQFNDRTFVVTKITHKASDKEAYSGTVEATEVEMHVADHKQTLITPFDMQGTQQGNILATVLESAVPKDWRFSDKTNFQTEMSAAYYGENETTHQEIGCIVRFATDDEQTTHWVALSPTSQSAPEVHSMVVVGRGSNESEIPEIQQVLSSHGQKTIQPPERRSNHWTANTSWGSNYSTSFGDGISIRYSNDSPVDMSESINIVESAYDNPGVLNTNYGNSSFNRGSSFGFNVSDSDASGLSNASVSAGCNFSESFSDQNYNVSYVGASQGYSKINKSVNVSYMGSYDDQINYTEPSFVNGKIPIQSIIDISDALADGSSYSQNHITGKTISLNGTGTAPATTYDSSATVYSHNQTKGKVMSYNIQTGDTISESTTTGDVSSTNVQIGDTTSSSTTKGDSTSTSVVVGDVTNSHTMTGKTVNSNTTTGDTEQTTVTIGDTTSTSTVTGDNTSTSTQTGDTTSTVTTNGNTTNDITTTGNNKHTAITRGDSTTNTTTHGNSDNTTKTYGNSTNNITTEGNSSTVSNTTGASSTVSTTMGATSSVDTFLGARSHLSTTIGAQQNTNVNIGLFNDTSVKLAVSGSQNVNLSASANASISLAANTSFSMTMGADTSTQLNLGSTTNISTLLGLSVMTDFNGGIKAQIEAGSAVIRSATQLKAELEGVKSTIVGLRSIL